MFLNKIRDAEAGVEVSLEVMLLNAGPSFSYTFIYLGRSLALEQCA